MGGIRECGGRQVNIPAVPACRIPVHRLVPASLHLEGPEVPASPSSSAVELFAYAPVAAVLGVTQPQPPTGSAPVALVRQRRAHNPGLQHPAPVPLADPTNERIKSHALHAALEASRDRANAAEMRTKPKRKKNRA